MSGFYTAATAMMLQQKRLNTTANNMANVKTSGYKAERVITSAFNDVLVGRQVKGSITTIGTSAPLSSVDAVSSRFTMADLEETLRTLDVAIGGDGFFNIESNGTTYLTRNGSFELNADGYLSLKGVGLVLGSGGPIQLENTNFTINEKGELFNSENELVDTLLVTTPTDFSKLVKQTNGLYLAGPDSGMQEGIAPIYQGKLERSNVDINQEMINLIEIQRSFQAVSNAMKTIDQLNGKAISEIAKV